VLVEQKQRKKEKKKRRKKKKEEERKKRERKEKKRFRIEISNYLVNTEHRTQNTNLKPYAPLFKTWCGFRFDES
jgi:hypothetical protein